MLRGSWFILLALAVALPGAGHAQSGGDGLLRLDPARCAAPLSAPASSGGAAYQPGVDVYGRPVVPAEGPGSHAAEAAAWAATRPVTLSRTLGDPSRAEGTVALGEMRVENGEALLAGRPLSPAPSLTAPSAFVAAAAPASPHDDLCTRLRALTAAALTRKPVLLD